MKAPRAKSKAALAAFAKVETICMAMPDVVREDKHGHLAFSRKKKAFAYCLDDHHGDGRLAIWCKASHDDQQTLVEMDPAAFFVPPYLGPRGWVGARLEKPNWKRVAQLLAEAHRLAGPQKR